jgi:TPR repeat protein
VPILASPSDALARKRDPYGDMNESDRNAVRYLEQNRASDKFAQYAIGSIYKRNGDLAKARRWLIQSADSGNPNAKALLSSIASEEHLSSKSTAIKVTSRRQMESTRGKNKASGLSIQPSR